MPASIGVNLRVTGHCRQGGRKYMEDFFSVAYQQTEDERDLEYAFFGIYDGHGGAEAAAYAKEHLMETIVKHKNFWSDNDEDVLRAIKDGYIETHYAMWREQEKWPKTASGLPSTAGTTASVAFIRRGKIYIGHVGDSGIILGYQEPGCFDWKARSLTKDHKPENAVEMNRITQCGGKVVSKSGVPRVVWNRPRIGHQGPVRRSTPIDEIPFLAVARSLGDLWSYNSQLDEFVISPDPDCCVIPIDTNTFRCLIFGTDGLYNMLSPQMAVHIVQQAERHNESAALGDSQNTVWLNPSRLLVDQALERWSTTKMRADNTSVITLMLDPPGPPRAQVLRNKRKNNAYPDSGLQIMTRYENNDQNTQCDLPKTSPKEAPVNDQPPLNTNASQTITEAAEQQSDKESAAQEPNFTSKPRESTSYDVREETIVNDVENAKNCEANVEATSNWRTEQVNEESIQINEISSSSCDFFEVTECEEKDQRKTVTSVKSTSQMTLRHKRTSSGINNKALVQNTVKRSSSETFVESAENKRRKCDGDSLQPDTSETGRSLRQRKPKQETKPLEQSPQKIASKSLTLQKKNLLRKVLAPKKLNTSYKLPQSKPVSTVKVIKPSTWRTTVERKVKIGPKLKRVGGPRKKVFARGVKEVKRTVSKRSSIERRKSRSLGDTSVTRKRSRTLPSTSTSSMPSRAVTRTTKVPVARKEKPNVPKKQKLTVNGRSLRSGFNLHRYTHNLRRKIAKKKLDDFV